MKIRITTRRRRSHPLVLAKPASLYWGGETRPAVGLFVSLEFLIGQGTDRPVGQQDVLRSHDVKEG